MKRPKSLHPHLPFLVTCTAGAFDLEDTAKFLIKSPLASGPSWLEQAPALSGRPCRRSRIRTGTWELRHSA